MSYDIESIRCALKGCRRFPAKRFHYFEEIDSTNAWIAGQPEIDGLSCLASFQHRGRGRLGRRWESSPGDAVLLSLGLSMPDNPDGLSLACGLATVRALAAQGIDQARLKWPNDILVDDRKLAGILVESSAQSVVIGIGINLVVDSRLEDRVGRALAGVAAIQPAFDRNRLVADLVLEHDRMLGRFMASGFSDFAQEWNELDAWSDRLLAWESGGRSAVGRGRGVGADGTLRLETADGWETIRSGEIRLANDDASASAPEQRQHLGKLG